VRHAAVLQEAGQSRGEAGVARAAQRQAQARANQAERAGGFIASPCPSAHGYRFLHPRCCPS